MPITTPPLIHYPVSLLEIGDSFFVPAISSKEPMDHIREQAALLGFTIEYKAGVDIASGLYGIRVVRVA